MAYNILVISFFVTTVIVYQKTNEKPNHPIDYDVKTKKRSKITPLCFSVEVFFFFFFFVSGLETFQIQGVEMSKNLHYFFFDKTDTLYALLFIYPSHNSHRRTKITPVKTHFNIFFLPPRPCLTL
jgi:hypothetical protein